MFHRFFLYPFLLIISVLIPVSAGELKLNELDLTHVIQSYGSPTKNTNISGDPIIINGEHFKEGIGTHAKSHIRVNLKGNSTRFRAKAGVTLPSRPDNAAISSIPLTDGEKLLYKGTGEEKKFIGVSGKDTDKIGNGSVVFRIICDGKELYNSGILKSVDKVREIDITLPGKATSLDLIVDDGKDGLSGDSAAWISPVISYEGNDIPSLTSTGHNLESSQHLPELAAHIREAVNKLPTAEIPLPKPSYDWLINRTKAKANVYASKEKNSLILSNGLTARTFLITPSLATMEYSNLMTGDNMLRALGNEGTLAINGKEYQLGGVEGQFEYGYFRYDWIPSFTAPKDAFRLKDVQINKITPRIKWAKSRWAGNKSDPEGKVLTFILDHPSKELEGITVQLHYALYDGIPVISKWMEVINNSTKEITINSFKLEQLPFAEPESPVELPKADDPRFIKPNIHIETDWAFHGFTEKEADKTEYWVEDPRYTSQCNYPRVTPCLLEVKLPRGPEKTISPGQTFSTFRVWEMPFDSHDRERKGLFVRQMYRTISPWLTENPIFMHCTSSDEKTVHTAIDQCAETGYEMIIISFGSGLNMEDESDGNYEKYQRIVDYAHSKGIQIGGYSLLSSRKISAEVDVIDPATGKPGGSGVIFHNSPCLATEWGHEYFRKIKTFFDKTGMNVFENDGSYPGNVCASTTHAHHKGLADSQWEQRKQISDLYGWMCEKGIYTNIPDFGYMHNGGNKVGIGYREVNWSLPRERQLVHGRQVNFDGTWERIPSMCWTFVPLTQYHGGGAAATLEPLSEHLAEYKGHMMQNYGAGIQACYRGHRLYDTDKTRDCVRNVIAWYKKYRNILNSDTIHLRRPDGRNYDGFLHVNPGLKEKALVMLFNPLPEDITRTISLPLYYTGLSGKAAIREREGRSKTYSLNRKYEAEVKVTLPAGGYTWLVVE